MADEATTWEAVAKTIAVSATLTAAAWGALGGATTALAVEVDRKAVIRQIALGSMVAAGLGTLAMAMIVWIWKVPVELVPAGAGAGGAHYLVGVFGPAMIERQLRKLTGSTGEGDDND